MSWQFYQEISGHWEGKEFQVQELHGDEAQLPAFKACVQRGTQVDLLVENNSSDYIELIMTMLAISPIVGYVV